MDNWKENLSRGEKKMRKMLAMAFVGLMLVVTLSGCIGGDDGDDESELYTYGDDDKLELFLELEKSEMSVNESVNAKVIVKNVGDRPIRFLRPAYTMWVYPQHVNGSSVGYLGPDYDLSKPKNEDLITLDPGEEFIYNKKISRSYWDFQSNTTYWGGDMVTDGVELRVI